jgi:curved DNA-binding protein CbpA
MAKNYFAILEITSNATPNEVHSAYRRLAKAFHPDRYRGGSEPFKQIQEAYSILGNPIKRKAYENRLTNVRVRKALQCSDKLIRFFSDKLRRWFTLRPTDVIDPTPLPRLTG